MDRYHTWPRTRAETMPRIRPITLMVFVPVVRGRTLSADQTLGFVANGVSCSSCVQQDLSCVCR